MAQDIRVTDELSTEKRAKILGLSYTDTSSLTEKPLYRDLLTNEELYSLRVIPLSYSKNGITFGITTTTSQQTMTKLTASVFRSSC
jgi:hypothetical protein